MIDFTNKVALVTGGSRGIGAATVAAFCRTGAHVIVGYTTHTEAAREVAEGAGPDRCHPVRADLAEPGAAHRLWGDALAWRGRIDILVNNAGVYEPAPLDASDEQWYSVWQKTLQVNLTATADLCREAIRHWLGHGSGGAIVNVASRAAFRGDGPDHWAYAASKGGMISLTKTLARAYSARGIFTYGVAPGWVETDMAQASFAEDPASRERTAREIPIGTIAPASDIAHAICFLASGLATHATGQTLDLNGASYVR
ncbi:MAG: SDR family oxidoreductase [Candidatus Eisenbacteria bacterium]|uniref:SDR family oxidoreductase n=1 Tax=Eiseniibacteriota bacterium TaxID=2212470 RepID=A0A956RQ70_UNCEI|nr:SDR family oxidoreductase [Candidatus Eisenbacteria bacterium]